MVDSQGNAIKIGSLLRSPEGLHDRPVIECISITDDTASMNWIGKRSSPFPISKIKLKNSKWVVCG